MTYCPFCGNELIKEGENCIYCGLKIPTPVGITYEFKFAIIISIIALSLIIIGIFFPLTQSVFILSHPEILIIENLTLALIIFIIPTLFVILFILTKKSFIISFILYQIMFVITFFYFIILFLISDIRMLTGGYLIFGGYLLIEVSSFIWLNEKKKHSFGFNKQPYHY
jgi:hypothetical protein